MSENNIDLPGRFAVYGTAGGKPAVVARFEDNDVWLTQKQLADLFNTTKQLVSHHIRQVIDSGELDRNRTVKKYLTVQTEGTRSIGRHVDHYNLDMIIALGYRDGLQNVRLFPMGRPQDRQGRRRFWKSCCWRRDQGRTAVRNEAEEWYNIGGG